ncbi:MAG: 16S rRNA processing protein RimM, partial [Oscillospiraceae bacterium]|nr:16S rRNA processing protein RimM [Oscillospiraceae bacterium]
DQNGKDFGELREVIQLPKHDVYVIRGNDGGEYQIPAVKEFVKRIDMEERTIEVVLIEGMRNDAD